MTADTTTQPQGPIDPHEAPKGFIAVPFTGCAPCEYRNNGCNMANGLSLCTPAKRADGRNVMFILTPPPPQVVEKHIPSAGMCAECSKNVPDKCKQFDFATMPTLRTLPAHKLVVVRCIHFER